MRDLIVLRCAEDGVVEAVVRDGGLAWPSGAVGRHVAELTSPESTRELLRWLARSSGDEFQTPITVAWQAGTSLTTTRVVVLVDDGRTYLIARPVGTNAEDDGVEVDAIDDSPVDAARAWRTETEPFFEQLARINNELAALQREVAKKNVALEQALAERNRYVGMAAHDLRLPLGVVLTYADFLQEELDGQLNDEQRGFLATIQQTVHFMLGLIDDLLDVSVIEAGELTLRFAPIDLCAFVERQVERHRPFGARKGITISAVLPDEAVYAEVDEARLIQVVDNLVGNAFKFSHAGTTVVLRVEVLPDAVSLSVEDQGQGMSAEDVAHLFKAFGRTRVRPTSGERTTGLGLLIVKRLIDGHGGRISVASERGRGSTFTAVLPRRMPESTA